MKRSLTENESGIALVTVLLITMLASGLMAGMFAALLASQRSHATDRDQSVAYAAAHAGLEKLTAGLAAQFATTFAPTAAQLAIVDNTPPDIPGFEYTEPGGGLNSGYKISFTADPGPGANTGNPLALTDRDITTGPFEGFKGLITPYVLTITARSLTGNSEVRLRRELQTVAVPVFQFGIFGEKSLGFHAGPNFDFGGRVHTNESLFLAAGTGPPLAVLTLRDKITAFTQVRRNTLMNGSLITATNHTGTVSIPTVIGGAPATYRNLASTESSGTTAAPWGGWKNLSEVTYHTNIRTEATGAKRLNLPLTSQGASPIDLIKRPPLGNENTTNAAVFGQRYFSQASLRILISDRAADLTGLPTITAGAPVDLSTYVPPVGQPPVALSPGPEPAPWLDPPTGNSLVKVSNVAGTTLTIQTRAVGPPLGAWVTGVPNWLRNPAATVLASTVGPPIVNLTCTGLTAGQLLGCNAGAGHLAFGNNTPLTITRFDGTPLAITTNGGVGINPANSAIIVVNLTAAQIATAYPAFSRYIFVGEDPVTCTGFTANALTGCTFPATFNAVLANDDPVYTGATTALNTPLMNGFIKIEQQTNAGGWNDVTAEILALGFTGPNQQGSPCANLSPNAILRFQRLRDSGMTAAGACTGAATVTNYANGPTPPTAFDFWPLTLYDAREGWSRNIPVTDGMYAGGLFGYVALDALNFRRWVTNTIAVCPVACTGNQTRNNGGYIVYFSDRRGDHDETAADVETGEYGNEDSINPGAAVWLKTNSLDTGENFNESGVESPVDNPLTPETLQMYGETPSAVAGVVPAGAIANMGFDINSRPWTLIGGAAASRDYSGRGRLARPVLFRRALKIINGGITGAGPFVNSLPNGFTVTSENPIYVEGNFNATAASVVQEPNVPAAIIGDSITLLSNNFVDAITFLFPNDAANRPATTTGYRFAMVTGKTIPFPKPAAWGVAELGSDGGVHNFMKLLENWNPPNPPGPGGQQTVRYRGSMVSLYYSRQAVGIYRADNNIYGAPNRAFNFDSDFLTPSLLPPGTPMFRDINTLKFRQILRPNQ